MIFLLSGPNKHYKEKYIKRLVEKYKNFNYQSFDCSETSQMNSEILDNILNAVSLFGEEEKIIQLKNFQDFSNPEYLFKLVEKHKDSKYKVIILDSNEKVKSNAKVVKLLKNKEDFIEALPYTFDQLNNIVSEALKGFGKESSNIASYLMKSVENDPYYLENEIQKILLLSQSGKKPDVELLDSVITKSISYSVWEYLKYMTSGDKYKAITTLYNLLEKGESEYSLLGMITWNLKLLTVISIGGYSKTDQIIAKDFGYNPYSVKNARKVVGNFPIKKIEMIYEKIIELDYKIKSGLIEPRLGLILLSLAF